MLDTCPTCLALLKPGHKACPVCGTTIPPAGTPTPKPPPPPPPAGGSPPVETISDDMLATAPVRRGPASTGAPVFGPGTPAASAPGPSTPGRSIGRPISGTPPVPPHAQSLVMGGVGGGGAGGGVGSHDQVLLAGGPTDGRDDPMLTTTPLLDLGRFVPGTMLGQRYRIVGRLGKGGMGEVYRADDLKLGQSVAMKFLPEELSQDRAALTRLIHEVKIARQVSHPNVCRVYDISDIDGLHFISMEFVDGEDLGTLLRRIGRLPHDKAVQIARQLCAGMQAAHEKGVLHRDLKPANVMIDGKGAVRIMDFGLAGLADELKQGGSRAGTPAYMSPEQLEGKGVTGRSDLYSLGLVLYEMFTGRPAYRPKSMAELAALHQKPLPSVRTLVPEVPEDVDAAVMRCLEREPAARHGSALAVAAALGGQDPLAAALAAGEMPSPELVAASGGQGALSATAAGAALAVVAALLAAIAVLNPWSRLYEAPRAAHPSVLAEKARDALRKAGVPAGADSASGFFEQRTPAAGETPAFAALRFWYRESPTPLISTSPTEIVGPEQPPPTRPGMSLVVLDAAGRLIKLQANPAVSSPPAGPAAPDFTPLLALANPDGHAEPTPPEVTPRTAADARAAWRWTDADGHAIHAEGASLAGSPVSFEVFPRWSGPTAAEPAGAPQFFITLLLSILGYGGPALLAWYNLRLGRGDRRGALRLALASGALAFLAQALLIRWAADPAALDLLEPALARSVFLAAEMWVLYIGVEPFIRQAWPQSLISWSRLLAGDVRDGLVGRDLLLGCALGAAWAVAVQGLYLAVGSRATPLAVSPEALAGLKPAAGHLIDIAQNAVFDIFIILLLVPIAKTVARGLIPAAAVVFLVLAVFLSFLLIALLGGAAPGGATAAVGIAGVLLAGAATWVLSRFGGLMLMAAFFTAGVLHQYPLTFDASRWEFAPSMVGVIAVGLLAAYGFRRTIAHRTLPAGWN